MKNTNRKNNKGFSLVELIIVMAIMAILVGIVGSQIIPYLEKSKIAKDKQVLSSLCTDAVAAFAMTAEDLEPDMDYRIKITASGSTVSIVGTGSTPVLVAIAKTFAELQGCTSAVTNSTIKELKYGTKIKLESKDAAENGGKMIVIEYNGTTGVVRVFAGYDDTSCPKIGVITSR